MHCRHRLCFGRLTRCKILQRRALCHVLLAARLKTHCLLQMVNGRQERQLEAGEVGWVDVSSIEGLGSVTLKHDYSLSCARVRDDCWCGA